MKNTVNAVRPATEAQGKVFLAMLLTQGITAETINAFEFKKLQEAIDSKGYLWFMLEVAEFVNSGSHMPDPEKLMVDLSAPPIQPFPQAYVVGNRGITRVISFLDITLLAINENLTGEQILKMYGEEYHFLNSTALDFIFMNQYDYRIHEHFVKKISLDAEVFSLGDLFQSNDFAIEDRVRCLRNQDGVLRRTSEAESIKPADYTKFAIFKKFNFKGHYIVVSKKMNQLGN